VLGETDGVIRLKLQAPAVEGKANAALLAFLAEALCAQSRREPQRRPEKSAEAGRGSGTRRRRDVPPVTDARRLTRSDADCPES
jgi:hypothetical protein